MSAGVHLLMSAGRGPQECAWAVAELAARLEAEAAGRGLATRRVQTVAGERPATFLSVLLHVGGPGAAEFAATWTGTLCWRAPSPYRTGAGRKNWYVIARPCDVDAPQTAFAEADVDVVPCRTGGPGGQRRNKVSTAVRATHRPSGLVVVADTERDLGQNRRVALDRLRRRLEERDRDAGRALDAARWHVHDELVRGDPVRTESPLRPFPRPGSGRR
jgi:peptide chain release factor